MKEKKDFAIYIITERTFQMVTLLCDQLSKNSHSFSVFISEKIFHRHQNTIQSSKYNLFIRRAPLPLTNTISENFNHFSCHIFFFSIGAIIRLIKDCIVDKKQDPAVIAIDEKARYCVCLLSGHIGRGNEFTRYIANFLQATPIITTASEVVGTLPTDILGREFGWKLFDKYNNLTQTAAAIINHYPVAFIQESGEPHFWKKLLPKNIDYFIKVKDCQLENYNSVILCSDRILENMYPQYLMKGILFRTQTLILGLGCDKNTSASAIATAVHSFLHEEQLQSESVHAVCSIDLKAQEPGILEFCKNYQYSFVTFPPEILDKTQGIQNPSITVKKYTGSRSVAEAACLQYIYKARKKNPNLEQNQTPFLYAKKKYQPLGQPHHVTVACARMNFITRN